MEPTPLNSSHSTPDEAALEAWLRSNVAAEPLADDGFSLRVVQALPPRRPAWIYNDHLRGWILAVLGAAVGLGVAHAQGATFDFEFVQTSARALETLNAFLQSPFGSEQNRQISFTLLACGGSLLIAYFDDVRRALAV